MLKPAKRAYEFGPFRLEPAEHLLLREGRPVLLSPKVFDILKVLVENNGHLFGKDDLMKAVWPDSFVEEGNLTRNISTLRTALGEKPNDHQYIETVPKRGYRFVGTVREVTEPTAGAAGASGLVSSEASELSSYEGAINRSIGRKGWGLRRSFAARSLVIVVLPAVALLVFWYAFFFRKARVGQPPKIKSLAVLPFKSLSQAKDDDYLGLGMADTIITRVSKINDLTVRPSSAVRKYANQQISPLEAAQELKVDSVLDGTIQRASDHLRINLNLFRTQDGTSIWSQTFDLNPTDTFKMQDEVSQQVAARLRLTLRPKGTGPGVPINPEAYDYFLRAKFHSGLQNPGDNEAAIELLERAIAVDPNFANAYATVAQEYRNRGVALKPQEREWEEKAFAAVTKALSLDPDLAEAHVSMGLLSWTRFNHFPHERAVEELRKALDLDPNLDEAHHQLANIYNHIGLLDKGQEEIQKAVTINPANSGARFRVGVNLLYQSRYDQALAAFREESKFNPQLWAYQTAWCLFQLGRRDEAAALIAESLKKYPEDEGGILTSIEAMLAAAAGETTKAEAKIQRAAGIGRNYSHFHHTAYAIASAYALMRKPELAVKWLKTAADDGFPCYPLFNNDPNLRNLHQDHRFDLFMSTLKQQWEHYQAIL